MFRELGRENLSVLALTSNSNRKFVESLGLYDDVIPYEELRLLNLEAVALVDFSGDRTLIGEIHKHVGEALKYSCVIGATHWRAIESPEATLESAGVGVPGPKPVMFHAPNQGRKRRKRAGS